MKIAVEKVVNEVLLNHPTDGLSFETSWNIYTIMKYLERNSNHISFPDTNHNVKNCRYQLVGGYCAVLIGLYCFGTWLINMAGVAKELILDEEFTYDAVVLQIASTST